MYRYITFVVLIVLGLTVFLWRSLVFSVAGYKPLGVVRAEQIDEPAAVDELDAPRFLAERNRVEVEVPRDMPLVEFLRLYQLEFAHIREQIATQEEVTSLTDEHLLRQGQRYSLTLTPPERGVP